MFCYRILDAGDDMILAICDKDIVGKTFEEKELTITVDQSFYCEKECTERSALRLSRKATIINATGNKIIGLLVAKKIVDAENVISIGPVRHAQVVVV